MLCIKRYMLFCVDFLLTLLISAYAKKGDFGGAARDYSIILGLPRYAPLYLICLISNLPLHQDWTETTWPHSTIADVLWRSSATSKVARSDADRGAAALSWVLRVKCALPESRWPPADSRRCKPPCSFAVDAPAHSAAPPPPAVDAHAHSAAARTPTIAAGRGAGAWV